MQVDSDHFFCLFLIDFFQSYLSTLNLLEIKLHNYFNLLSQGLSWSCDLVCGLTS
jgi:hypothetical protein